MIRRTLALVGAATIAVVACAGLLLRTGPDVTLDLTELRSFTSQSRFTGDQCQIGSGRVGWGTASSYQTNSDWGIASPRLDRELARLGFTRASPLMSSGATWISPNRYVYAQVHWTRATGRRLSGLVIFRPAIPGEILQAKFARWKDATFR